jgi:hypothetical protein
MAKISFTERVVSSGDDHLILIQGVDTSNSRKVFFFLLVPEKKLGNLTAAHATGDINLEEYGTIIESGYGYAPPDELIEKITKKFLKGR